MRNEEKEVIAVSIDGGDVKKFNSINEAARFLGSQFQGVQLAMVRGGACRGWRIYPSAENIRRQISFLRDQLEIVENLHI